MEETKARLLECVTGHVNYKTKALKEQSFICKEKLKNTTGLLQYTFEVLKENDPAGFLTVIKTRKILFHESYQLLNKLVSPSVICRYIPYVREGKGAFGGLFINQLSIMYSIICFQLYQSCVSMFTKWTRSTPHLHVNGYSSLRFIQSHDKNRATRRKGA